MKCSVLLVSICFLWVAGCESYSRQEIEDCGDGTCYAPSGENPCTCPDDCLDESNCCEDSDCPDLRCGPCCESVCEDHVCVAEYLDDCCGNGKCEAGEDAETCPADCDGECGDGTCDTAGGEDPCTCPVDCLTTGTCCDADDCPDVPCGLCCGPACEDHRCITVTFEDCCGNGLCETGEDNQNCPQDCPGPCGNGRCEEQHGEDPCTCPADCLVPGTCCEDTDCPQPECGPCCVARCDDHFVCGVEWLSDCCWNGICEEGETPDNCPEDCGEVPCGDGICNEQAGEDPCNCPADCLTGDRCCVDEDCPPFDCGPCCIAVCGDDFFCEAVWLPDCCWNNICEDGEDPCNCPEDCGQPVCGDGICCQPDENSTTCPDDCPSDCVPEGGIPGSDEMCCPPFEMLNSNYATMDGECLGSWCYEPVCAACGDGVCGIGENYCSCPEDCADTTCLHENGMSMLVDGAMHDCCEGLTPAEVPGTTCSQYTCILCGDGQCGLFETPENCPVDCD